MKKRIKNIKVALVKRWLDGFNEQEKHEILTMAVKRFYNSIDENDILKRKSNKWFYRDKAMTENEVKTLIAEAHAFLNTRLWKVLKTDIEYQANKRMFLHSSSEIDLIAGKIALFNLEAIKTRLNTLTQADNGML
jgi:hypothetical protein